MTTTLKVLGGDGIGATRFHSEGRGVASCCMKMLLELARDHFRSYLYQDVVNHVWAALISKRSMRSWVYLYVRHRECLIL